MDDSDQSLPEVSPTLGRRATSPEPDAQPTRQPDPVQPAASPPTSTAGRWPRAVPPPLHTLGRREDGGTGRFAVRPGDTTPTAPLPAPEAGRAPEAFAAVPGSVQTWPVEEVSPLGGKLRTWAYRGFRAAFYLVLAWVALVAVAIVTFRFVNPPGSMLMAWQAITGEKITRRWVPLSHISPQLVRAVVVSEDGRFCQHWGVDMHEIGAAMERARGGIPRGASTISMQVAKNLFLWPSKSYVRKALEFPLTVAIELVWPKWRIAEVYLNIAEWGPGIFGAEAAARYHFAKPALRLTEREAALLAVALPNPIRRDAGDPGPGTARLAAHIQARIRNEYDAANCVLGRVAPARAEAAKAAPRGRDNAGRD
jgi:monofunctional biosynthetic peptidoglycan transglycosylase